MIIKDFLLNGASAIPATTSEFIQTPSARSIEQYLFSDTEYIEVPNPPILRPAERPSVSGYLLGESATVSYPLINIPCLDAPNQPSIEEYLFDESKGLPAPTGWGNITGEQARILISGMPNGAVLGTGVNIALDTRALPATSVGNIGKFLQLSSSGTNIYSEVDTIVNWGDIQGTLSEQTDLQEALNAKENNLGNPSIDDYVLSSKTNGTRSWIAGGGSSEWGAITGDITQQTDLAPYIQSFVPEVYTEVTVAELKNLITTSGLTPQAWYLITDYQTIDYIRQTQSPVEFYTGAVEQIYVQASSANTIHYDGYSKTFAGEIIGYLADRFTHTESPEISYSDTNYGTVGITPLNETQFELSDNPFPSNPDDESSFSCYIYDTDNDVWHTFNNSDKGINWEFDVDGYFTLLNTQYPYPVYFDVSYSWEEGNSGSQEIEILTSTTFGATTPNTNFNSLSNSSISFNVSDTTYGAVYYDIYSRDETWKVNEDGEIELLDAGIQSQLSGYLENYENYGDINIVIDTATDLSFDVSDMNLQIGRNGDGYYTTIYVTWTDEVYEEFILDNYKTTWDIVDNKIRLIGNTHSLLTDVLYLEAYPIMSDQTQIVDLAGESYVSGDFYFDELRTMDLTNSLEVSGSWTYTAAVLGGLIVNRRVPDYDIDICFDFRATKNDRFKIKSTLYDSGTVYTAGQVVNYGGSSVHIKTWSEGTIRPPAGSAYYLSWAYVSPSVSYYVMGRNNIAIYNDMTIQPDTTQSYRSGLMQYYGENFNYDLTLMRGLKIKYAYNTRYIGSGPDIVIRGTNSYNSTINLTQSAVVSLNVAQNVDVTLDYTVVLTGDFRDVKGSLTNYIGYNLNDSEIASMSSTLWYNTAKNKIIGTIQKLVCGGNDQSYGNTVATQILNSRIGWYIQNNTINTIQDVQAGYYLKGNLINAMMSSNVGWYIKNNQIYSECYGITTIQEMDGNRIYGEFGKSITNPPLEAGNFYNFNGNDVYGTFYKAVNNNLGGTTKYNDFYMTTNNEFYGNVNSNNVPYVTLNRNRLLTGMSHVDKIVNGTVTDNVSYNTIGGNFYNFRFTGRTTMTNNVIDGSFQNGWFGGGTFASPTDNSSTRNFTYNKVFGNFQQFQGETGYVNRNVWLGSCEAYGSTYTKFNCGVGVEIGDNQFGVLNKGNQFLKQMIGCVIGSNAGNNTFNANCNRVTFGTDFINNTLPSTTSYTACNFANGIANTTLPTLGQGVTYPNLLLKGNANGGAGNIFDCKNLTDLQLFMCNNSGQFSVGATAPPGQLTVYRHTNGPGTVTNSAGGTTVTGTNTIFLNTFKVGDSITIGGQTVTIASISGNTNLVVTPAITNANSGATYTTTGIPVFVAYAHGRSGINRIRPVRALDINDVAGECLRLVYNDDDGVSTNYVDFLVSSSGDLTITASGGDITTTNVLQAGGYKSSDGTDGLTDTITFVDGDGDTHTFVYKNGLLTSHTIA